MNLDGGALVQARRAAATGLSRFDRRTRRRARPGLRILMYHSIGARPAHDAYGWTVGADDFAAQLESLVAAPDLAVVPLGVAPTGQAHVEVALTFDDGFEDALTTAAPLLERHGFPYAVFAVSGYVDARRPGYLDPAQLRELAARPGATIGSHGATHARCAECDDAQLARELAGSRARLAELVGREVDAVAYPHGSVDARVRDAARAAGYRLGLCSHPPVNARGRDPLLLCRTEVLGADSLEDFAGKVDGSWDWRRHLKRDPARGPR